MIERFLLWLVMKYFAGQFCFIFKVQSNIEMKWDIFYEKLAKYIVPKLVTL